MVIIRFTNEQAERRGLGFLASRFACKTWDNGQTMVPEAALAALAHDGIAFSVKGPANYDHLKPGVPAALNPAAA
ncbi:MAG: hypothetical protein WD042_02905 [Phycisphaeraceae bacterium]